MSIAPVDVKLSAERLAAYGPEDTVSPAVLPELEVDLSLVFREQVTG